MDKENLEVQIEKLRKELSSLSNTQAIYDNEINKAFEQLQKIFGMKKKPTVEAVMKLIDSLEEKSAGLLKEAEILSKEAAEAMKKYESEKNDN